MNKDLNIIGLIAMILSFIGLFLFGIPCGIASVVLGIIGVVTAGETKGKGMAITGIVVGAFDAVAVSLILNMIQAA